MGKESLESAGNVVENSRFPRILVLTDIAKRSADLMPYTVATNVSLGSIVDVGNRYLSYVIKDTPSKTSSVRLALAVIS